MKYIFLMSLFAVNTLICMEMKKFHIIGCYYAEIGQPYQTGPKERNLTAYPLYIKRNDSGDIFYSWFNCVKPIKSVGWESESGYSGLNVVLSDGKEHFIPWNPLRQ